MASRYKPIRKPIYAPNAKQIGHTEHSVKDGDYIMYVLRADGCPSLGRVLGQATHDGTGKKYGKPTLLVLQASDDMSFGYTVHVPIADVTRVRRRGPGVTGDFACWFFQGDLPSVEEVERAVEFGSMSDFYIGRYLEGGNLVGFAEGERPIRRNNPTTGDATNLIRSLKF